MTYVHNTLLFILWVFILFLTSAKEDVWQLLLICWELNNSMDFNQTLRKCWQWAEELGNTKKSWLKLMMFRIPEGLQPLISARGFDHMASSYIA